MQPNSHNVCPQNHSPGLHKSQFQLVKDLLGLSLRAKGPWGPLGSSETTSSKATNTPVWCARSQARPGRKLAWINRDPSELLSSDSRRMCTECGRVNRLLRRHIRHGLWVQGWSQESQSSAEAGTKWRMGKATKRASVPALAVQGRLGELREMWSHCSGDIVTKTCKMLRNSLLFFILSLLGNSCPQGSLVTKCYRYIWIPIYII